MPPTDDDSEAGFADADGTAAVVDSRPKIWWLLGPIIALVIIANIGDAFAPQWVDRHPLWLISMNARSRNLALTTNNLDALSYYGVGSARLLLSDPLFYLLGMWYGDDAIRWLERRTPSIGEFMRRSEGWFSKAAYPLVFAAPNNPICLLAGAAGMKPSHFFITNITGTFARLYAIRVFGDIFSSPLESVTDFIGEYRLPLTVLAFAWVGWSLRSELKKGREHGGGLNELTELDDGPPSSDPR